MAEISHPDIASNKRATETVARGASPARILVALSPRDRKRFFPHGTTAEGVAADWRIANPEELEGGNWESLLKSYQPDIIVTAWSTPQLVDEITDADWFNVRYICNLSGSVKNLLSVDMLKRGVVVTNWGNLISASVAEHAVLLALGCARRMPVWKNIRHLKQQPRIDFITSLQTKRLKGRSVGIHGFGQVARELISLLHPFGVKLSAYSKPVPASMMREHDVEPCASLEALFENNDILIECEALTDETQGCVSRSLLERLPEDAIFINVARGALVDEDALADMAEQGRLRVGLDVYAIEPLDPSSRLWDIPEVILSPHIAGPTHDIFEHCGEFALNNIRCFLNKQPLSGIIDIQSYLRSS